MFSLYGSFGLLISLMGYKCIRFRGLIAVIVARPMEYRISVVVDVEGTL